jgi:SAM-dependent methyltransferase
VRVLVKEFVRLVAETLPVPEPIYEFGALQVPGQEGFADLRPLFPGRPYVGCDLRPGPGVDRVLDLHRIDLPDGAAGTVLLLDTLEHVERFWVALDEVRRILRPGGLLLLSSVMDFPIHDHPADYWRFTPEGFRALLRPFDPSFVGYAGEADAPHTVVGLGYRGGEVSWEAFLPRYRQWQKRWRFPWGWRSWIALFLPAGFSLLRRRLRRTAR